MFKIFEQGWWLNWTDHRQRPIVLIRVAIIAALCSAIMVPFVVRTWPLLVMGFAVLVLVLIIALALRGVLITAREWRESKKSQQGDIAVSENTQKHLE